MTTPDPSQNYSTYSVTWYCNACGERFDIKATPGCPTPDCLGQPEGIAHYIGPGVEEGAQVVEIVEEK